MSTHSVTATTSSTSPSCISNKAKGPGSSNVPPPHCRHPSIITQRYESDDGGNQSDSSSNSNSSLASSSRYNERHPRAGGRKSGRGCCGINGCGPGVTTARGSFVILGSRTSLPPLNENCPLDATESQLALNLRRATRSSSWTNQKILDAIDGLNTCAQELDPCLALGVAPGGGSVKRESPRHSFEKFVVPKSISNLIMQSRSSGSVNPATSGQNRENSSYNFLSGITEDEDEEQEESDKKFSSYTASGGGGSGVGLTRSPTTIPKNEKRKHIVAGGEVVGDDLLNLGEDEPLGRLCSGGNVNSVDVTMKKVMIHQDEDCPEQVISEMDVSVAGTAFDKQGNNTRACSLYGRKGKKERPTAHQHHLHGVRFEDDDDDVPPQL